MHEEIWLAKLFNDNLPGVGNAFLKLVGMPAEPRPWAGFIVMQLLVVLILILRGWRWAVAYLLGAAASYLNFRWLKRVVDALGGALTARPSPKFAILIGLRYVLLGAGAYAIVNFTSLSLPAALIGLFVPVAAVIMEIVFELVAKS